MGLSQPVSGQSGHSSGLGRGQQICARSPQNRCLAAHSGGGGTQGAPPSVGGRPASPKPESAGGSVPRSEPESAQAPSHWETRASGGAGPASRGLAAPVSADVWEPLSAGSEAGSSPEAHWARQPPRVRETSVADATRQARCRCVLLMFSSVAKSGGGRQGSGLPGHWLPLVLQPDPASTAVDGPVHRKEADIGAAAMPPASGRRLCSTENVAPGDGSAAGRPGGRRVRATGFSGWFGRCR